MRFPRLTLLAALCALAATVASPPASAAGECNGIPRCIPVEGPWVAVSARGESDFLLDCPGRQGTVAGTDGLASSPDIHVTFDGILGSPVAFGRTTSTAALFRGISGLHRPGSFKPFIGCIPTPTSIRNTIAARATPVGPSLDLRDRTVPVVAGRSTVSLACGAGEVLVDGWSAKAFRTTAPPPPGLATTLTLTLTLGRRSATLQVGRGGRLAVAAKAEVQLGIRCTQA